MDIASLGTDIDADLNRIRSREGERPKKPPRYSQDFIFPIEGSDAYQFLFDDESEELCASGPYGCSKTFVSVMKLHRRALYTPGAYGIARKTKESIKKSVCKTYAKVLGYDPMLTKKTYVRGNGGQNPQSYHYPNGSVIHIVGLNHLDGLLSTEFDGIFVNQAEELNYDEWQLLGRRTRDGKNPQIWSDCNPSFPQHFLAPGNSKEITPYTMRHKDNPEYWGREKRDWTEKGRREIAKLKRMTGTRYRRGYLGEWCAAEGIVYDGYDPNRHDIDCLRGDFGSDTDWHLSIDYGFTHPTSVGLWGRTPQEHVLFKEIYHTGLTVDDLIGQIDKMLRDNDVSRSELSNIFCDHDAEHNERMEREGFGITLADKEVLPGIDLVKQHLENGTIKFNRGSLIKADESLFGQPQRVTDEFLSYAYRPEDKRTHDEKDEYPVKKFDDGMDMTRYYVKGVDDSNTYYQIGETMSINEAWGY